MFTPSATGAASHGEVRCELQRGFIIGLQKLGQIKNKLNVKATHKGGFFCGAGMKKVPRLDHAQAFKSKVKTLGMLDMVEMKIKMKALSQQ